MNILLDHCVPRPLRCEFPGHDITTTREMGWEALKNGTLLDAAQAAGFVVLLTVDHDLRYQQNLQGIVIAVIVAIAGGITVADLRPLRPAMERTLLQLLSDSGSDSASGGGDSERSPLG